MPRCSRTVMPKADGAARRRRWSNSGARFPTRPDSARPARSAGPSARALDARPFARLHRHGPDGAPVLAVRFEPSRQKPAARDPGGQHPFRPADQGPIKLFVTATNVRTGQGRVFRNSEITPDVLLASSCLPTLFHAVEIEGEA